MGVSLDADAEDSVTGFFWKVKEGNNWGLIVSYGGVKKISQVHIIALTVGARLDKCII
jgi:hypothetical protein